MINLLKILIMSQGYIIYIDVLLFLRVGVNPSLPKIMPDCQKGCLMQ